MTTTLEPAPPEASDWEPRRRRVPEIGPAWRAARRRFAGEGMTAQAGRYVALFVVFAVFIELLFHSVLSVAYLVDGIALGSLYGIVGVALILIYRTNRIINFAAAAVGAVPAIAALLLDVAHGVSFLAVMPIALFGGALFGAITDLLVIRRFSKSPRLILSVVTVGVAQGFGALGFFIPVWMGVRAGEIPTVPTPWEHWKILNGRGQPLLTGNQVAALVVVVVMAVLLALFLRYTRIGIALRASAENADRASLLGIPVKRVQTVAWILAGALAAMAILVQAPLIGVPQDASLGFKTLLYGLTAAVVARMERIGLALAAGLGIGVIIFGAVAKYGSDDYASALMLIVILVSLLVQRGALSRAYDAGTSTWESVKMFRPIPAELRGQREVVIGRIVLFVASVALVVVLPFVIGKPNIPDLVVLPIFGIVAVSLVILTGWAGQ